MKRGKKYNEALKKLTVGKEYSVQEACGLIKGMSYAKFDESVELHVKLNLKKSQSVRDTLVFPNNFGKEKKILVFARDDKAQEAKDNGAAYVGDMDLIEKIKGGWDDFDICVSTPDMMKEVGKLGPILGRRGLMPNPKTHTVTTDIKGALAQLKMGRVEFRADKTGVIHLVVGKISMDEKKLEENITVALDEISKRKPQDAKGVFIQSISVCSTMSPGVAVANTTI
jgi:large subunit ribosomal protein L1